MGEERLSHDEFVMQLIAVQGRLQAYILSLVLDRDRANDILQQTNLVILEKEPHFTPGSNFSAWTAKIAFYEVLTDRRHRQRSRLLFSDEMLQLIADHADAALDVQDERIDALNDCIGRLSKPHRDLVAERYREGGSVSELASKYKKSAASISAMLYRIRSALTDCVQRTLEGYRPQ